MRKKKCIAMLLAGGQGSRLCSLTKNIAKPAVPFGGKYRIIDFTLSNCTNSGIDTVGVLTQYQPLLLHSYIGIGSAWDLDRKNGGVTVLPPYSVSSGVKWYEGTANAIYQNINYIEQYDPDYVLVLSGDHIYKMNYRKMLDYHIAKQADATISVIEVPWSEASRFGIMNTNEQMEIIEFEEKPANPKSNLASMGIYIFNWPLLKEYLQMDNADPHSSHDFGKDVIPLLLREKKRLVAYSFKGYWKDVGTVKSLWEANMDLLDEENELNLFDHSWRIYSVNPNQPPQYISDEAVVINSLVNEGCMVEGNVEHSVLFQGVHIGKGAIVKNCVIMPDVVIGEGTYIEKAIVTPNVEIPPYMVIRSDDVLLVTKEWLQEQSREDSWKG
jgi:glucose-1-phosphate adenylyltransferase